MYRPSPHFASANGFLKMPDATLLQNLQNWHPCLPQWFDCQRLKQSSVKQWRICPCLKTGHKLAEHQK